MRRGFFFFLLLLVLAGGGAAWYLTRPTPDRVLADALTRFSKLPGANVRVNLFWDRLSPSGQGYVLDTWMTYGGLVDVRDPSRIALRGAAGYGKTQNPDDFQTANVAVNTKAISVQLMDTDPSLVSWFESAAGTSTTKDTWFSFDREILLKEKNLSAFLPMGRAEDLRVAWNDAQFSTWASVRSSKERMTANGAHVFDAELILHQNTIETALISLQSAWMAKDPSPVMLDWAHRAAQGVQSGEWHATYSEDGTGIHSISGKWPTLDDEGRVNGHVTIQIDVLGAATVQDAVPDGAIDLTTAIRPAMSPGFSPSSNRVIPEQSSSSTALESSSTSSQP